MGPPPRRAAVYQEWVRTGILMSLPQRRCRRGGGGDLNVARPRGPRTGRYRSNPSIGRGRGDGRLGELTTKAVEAACPGSVSKNRLFTAEESSARIEPEPLTSWKTL